MSDIICGYAGDREAALMGYLYDEMPPEGRAAFDAHLAACARCRSELAAFGSVRRQLARWSPPDFASIPRSLENDDTATHDLERSRRWWRDMPAWAQVAAAMLFVGVAAGVANLDVHYDAQHGLNVRTGWAPNANRSNALSASAENAPTPANAATPAPWRGDLTALEQELRSEMHASPSAAAPAALRASSSSDAELMRRFKVLVDDSERRQQRELALRVTALIQDLNAQRQADLRKIDQNLGIIQDRTGVEVLKNRQMIDYYIQRVSQRP